MKQDQALFLNRMKELQTLAKNQGLVVTKTQVSDAIEEFQLGKEGMEQVEAFLKSNKIGIDESLDLDSFLSTEEKDYYEIYLKELEELPQYSDGEKKAFEISALAGEQDAKDKLIQIYLPKVAELAKLYTGQGMLIEDLIGEGNLSLAITVELIGCLEKSDEVEGFLVKKIMDSMEEAIYENSNEIKLEEEILNKVKELDEKAHELALDLGRKITVKELSDEMQMSEDEIEEAIFLSGSQIPDIEIKRETGE